MSIFFSKIGQATNLNIVFKPIAAYTHTEAQRLLLIQPQDISSGSEFDEGSSPLGDVNGQVLLQSDIKEELHPWRPLKNFIWLNPEKFRKISLLAESYASFHQIGIQQGDILDLSNRFIRTLVFGVIPQISSLKFQKLKQVLNLGIKPETPRIEERISSLGNSIEAKAIQDFLEIIEQVYRA